MTWDQYWYGDVWMVGAFLEAEKMRIEKQNQFLWMQGLYIYEALCDVSPVLHAFAKKGTKPQKYKTEPYPLFGKNSAPDPDREEKIEEANRLKAELYMRQMVKAGKNWGKRGGSNGG